MATWSVKAQQLSYIFRSYIQSFIEFIGTLGPKYILYHLILFISYVLCFVYLYKPNTEMASVFLFFLLHIVFLFFVVSYRITLPTFNIPTWQVWQGGLKASFTTNSVGDKVAGRVWDITQLFNINYAEYSIVFITIGWVLLSLAFTWLLPVYIKIYQAYIPLEKDMTFGEMETFKESLIRWLIGSTVLLWLFYIVQNIKNWSLIQNFMTKHRVVNSFIIALATFLITSSVYSLQLSRYISKNIHTILTPT
uniref:Uncharacterized protein n=1 Tax=viral metagenome TaxID=1070528 RepID=A0A6C0IC16_9ZZZZ